jgi:hypothetical protein
MATGETEDSPENPISCISIIQSFPNLNNGDRQTRSTHFFFLFPTETCIFTLKLFTLRYRFIEGCKVIKEVEVPLMVTSHSTIEPDQNHDLCVYSSVT